MLGRDLTKGMFTWKWGGPQVGEVIRSGGVTRLFI